MSDRFFLRLVRQVLGVSSSIRTSNSSLFLKPLTDWLVLSVGWWTYAAGVEDPYEFAPAARALIRGAKRLVEILTPHVDALGCWLRHS
jgi:hypothetical protein